MLQTRIRRFFRVQFRTLAGQVKQFDLEQLALLFGLFLDLRQSHLTLKYE